MTKSDLVILNAMDKIGIQEFPGKNNSSPTILGWIKKLIPGATEDEINWCSIFCYNMVSEVLPDADLSMVTAAARSWLGYGYPTTNPKRGDIVIFWRESPTSWQGHVAMYVRENNDYVWVLGGNQSDQVSIAKYSKDRVLGYRTHELISE